jgi:hypothetical protein
MLIVGLFAVLTWDAAYPERRDVLVLGPLPIRASTIFFAKIVALAIALSLTVITFNGVPGLLLPFALAPHTATIPDLLFTLVFYHPFAVYWVTMLAAGTFVFCCVLIVQGIAVQLPRRVFLQLSPVLQIAAFCVFVGGYFLEPSLAAPEALRAPENQHLLVWLPSYWFLGLFQELNGSLGGPARPILVALANRAWIGLGSVVLITCVTFVFSYVRTLRKIVEHPDIAAFWKFNRDGRRAIQRPHAFAQPAASRVPIVLRRNSFRGCHFVYENTDSAPDLRIRWALAKGDSPVSGLEHSGYVFLDSGYSSGVRDPIGTPG